MKGVLKRACLFLLISIFSCMVNAAAQGNTIISSLSYERHRDSFLLKIETKEPANIVCHAVKNPPSIIITSPEEIFTNLPERIKIGGSVKSIRSVNGFRKVPEELDESFHNVSFFVVDLKEPKKFEVTKQETKFLLNIALKPKAVEKSPIAESVEEKTATIGLEYKKKEVKKIEAKKSVKETKESKPSSSKSIKEEKADTKKVSRDKQIELALEDLTKRQKKEASSVRPQKISAQEKRQPPKEGPFLISEKKTPTTLKKEEFVETSKAKETVLRGEERKTKSSSVDMANESARDMALLKEMEKKRFSGIDEEPPEKVKASKTEPKRENVQKITQVEEALLKDEPRVDGKKLAKIDSAIQELTKKEEREEKKLLEIPEESQYKVKDSKTEPKRENVQKITQVEEALLKDEPGVNEKKLAKIDSAIRELIKKEEKEESNYREKLKREKEPVKEIQEDGYRQNRREPSVSKEHKPSSHARETVERLENLKEEINKSIEDRIQAELLKDSSSRRWEGSKERLDDALSR